MEVCLHLSQIRTLENSWSDLPNVNSSLVEQQNGINLLWKYITDKIPYKGNLWYKIAKTFTEKIDENDIDEVAVLKWCSEIEKDISKASHLIKLADFNSESTEQAVNSLGKVSLFLKIIRLVTLR